MHSKAGLLSHDPVSKHKLQWSTSVQTCGACVDAVSSKTFSSLELGIVPIDLKCNYEKSTGMRLKPVSR